MKLFLLCLALLAAGCRSTDMSVPPAPVVTQPGRGVFALGVHITFPHLPSMDALAALGRIAGTGGGATGRHAGYASLASFFTWVRRTI